MHGFPKIALASVSLAVSVNAFAQTHSVYFNQYGKLTATMSAVAYVRQYKIESGMAQVQDFYYPSMKKYSDPYQVSAGQIKVFVPTLNNGTLTLWHFNGQKKMVGSYKNGKPNGEWINWYPNGKKSALMPYINGLSEGVGSRYYRNGVKESEIQFKQDKANGYWRQWYADGKPKSEMVMSDNKPVRIVSWDEEGRLLTDITISNGMRNGIVLDWYEDGSKKSELLYQNDKVIKKRTWDKDGYQTE
ncbi:toxin-antitoxin system YwqK family antitoxin [Neisseria sp. ZJ106]|uniref:Toxin-antitoxin system YwqK family antitoxin n=1 Tax=Neisseria lisongii TaxID=2912188 RepID=A0AAW5AK71_9NEIS|nr:toxin-antitoxin system YwqK family antitoxin [Neisseria lisongii]MCF7521036.1 toxin-antitoxin system YwqK family antitoxin [Neisseria lisongii]MCF7528860.1 toxin-antitoxin system YwqK family antitoxin [Neisseria lisongii]WCL71970.1 toxin-antitoxin system YwqK family antitoxin [Neisseria lisongii]